MTTTIHGAASSATNPATTATTATSSPGFTSSPYASSLYTSTLDASSLYASSSSSNIFPSPPVSTQPDQTPLRKKPRLITCGISPSSPDEKAFEENLERIQKIFHSIADDYFQLAADVYSLSAPTANIGKIAQTWTKQAEKLQRQIAEVETTLQTLQTQAPFLPASSLVKNMQKLQALLMKLICLKKPVGTIQFVQSPIYIDTYVICKNAIKKCEHICSEAANQKLGTCKSLFATTLEKIKAQQKMCQGLDEKKNQHLMRQVLTLHINTLEVFQHRMSRELTANSSTELFQNISAAIDATQKIFKPQPPLLKDKDTTESPQLKTYKGTYPQVELPTILNFLQSNFFTDFFKTRVTYANIAESIEQMKLTARGIYKRRCDLRYTSEAFSRGKPPKQEGIKNIQQECHLYESAYHALKENLESHKKQLLENAKEGEIHAGLYYDALLQRMLSEIKYQIFFLKNCTANEMQQVTEAQQLFGNVLSSTRDASSSPLYGQMRDFFRVSKTLSELCVESTLQDPDVSRLYETVRKTLQYAVATQSPNVLQHPQSSKDVATKIIQQAHLDSIFQSSEEGTLGVLPDRLKAMLTKEMTHWLYFPDSPPNFMLDVILTLLQTEACYKYLYTQSAGKEFLETVAQYEAIRGPLDPHIRTATVSFARYFSLINRCQAVNGTVQKSLNIQEFFVYSESQAVHAQCEAIQRDETNDLADEPKRFFQKIFQNAVLTKQQEIKRISSYDYNFMFSGIESDPEQFTTELYQKSLYTFNKIPISNILFTTLSKALYGQESEKAQATECLTKFLKTALLNFEMPDIGSAKLLLIAFILTQMEKSSYSLSVFEKKQLADFYSGFLINLTIQNAFNTLFGTGYMELQLYTLTYPDDCPVSHEVRLSIMREEARGKIGFEQWRQGMSHYKLFIEHPGPKQPHIDELDQHLKDTATILSQGSTYAYRDALVTCHKEMENKLKGNSASSTVRAAVLAASVAQ